jgi:hypothetical protein
LSSQRLPAKKKRQFHLNKELLTNPTSESLKLKANRTRK